MGDAHERAVDILFDDAQTSYETYLLKLSEVVAEE